MLIISRKPGEGFWIDEKTEVVVVSCHANVIKLGVRAPREVLVLRSELKLVQEQNQAATATCSPVSIDILAARMRRSQS